MMALGERERSGREAEGPSCLSFGLHRRFSGSVTSLGNTVYSGHTGSVECVCISISEPIKAQE